MSPAQAQQAVLPDYLRKRGLIRATIFSPANSWKIILLAVVFLALHQLHLRKLFSVWVTEPDWSHGFIIPLFSLYFLASNYQRLLKVRVKPSRFGLLLVLGGLGMEAIALILRFDYALYLGMIVLLFGIILFLTGWQVMKIVWLPILFLFFAVNVPEMIYREVAYAFQQFAAHASVFILQITGVEADMAGAVGQAETVITMVTVDGKIQQLNVEEACSGMRLLMAFGALSVAVSYLSDRAPWQRIILVLSALPIALLCNLLRVLITGYLYNFGYPEYAQGIFHTFTGLLMLIPAGVLFLGLAKLLDLLLVEDYSGESESKSPPAADPAPPQLTDPQASADAESSSPTPAPNSVWRQLVSDRTYLTCLIIVLIAATGLQGAIGALNMSLLKKPAPLRNDFASLPIKLGSFEARAFENHETGKEEIDVTLSEELVHSLGTELYLQRTYVDAEPTDDTAPAVTLFTTYYTGKPVLVPHVPERCQAAAGYTKGKSETFTVEIPGVGLPNDTLIVRTTAFSGTDEHTGDFKSFAIIYFFVANGDYFDYWVDVRVHFKTPKAYFLDKHSYYAFLRLTFPQSKDQDQCVATAKKFLRVALPEMVKIWPDWQQLEQDK